MALRREEGEQRHRRHRGGGWPRRALHARPRLGSPLRSHPKDPVVEEPSGASTPTIVGTPEQLDLLSLVKALLSISSEIVLPRLAEALLQNMLQQAGGQRGVLILVRDGELAVQA